MSISLGEGLCDMRKQWKDVVTRHGSGDTSWGCDIGGRKEKDVATLYGLLCGIGHIGQVMDM